MRSNAHNTGKAFESMISNSINSYRDKLKMKKVDPPTRVVGSGNFRKVIFLENPFPDFVGCWTERGGRAVFIECKSTGKPKLPFNSDNGITVKQMQNLHHWHSGGAVVFVLWQHNNSVRLVPAPVIFDAETANTRHSSVKHVDWENSGTLIQQGIGMCLVDFLPAMHLHWPAR